MVAQSAVAVFAEFMIMGSLVMLKPEASPTQPLKLF